MATSPLDPLSVEAPLEPPLSTFAFPSAATADSRGRVIVGGDLEPGTVLSAYRSGLFPMRQANGELAWWSPDPRAVISPSKLTVGRTLRRARRHYFTTLDTAFEAVIDGCADRGEDEYRWISAEVREAFVHLHRLGWAHSVETWTLATDGESPKLVGGLYGLAIGGLFSGESMFHRQRDASKAALVSLAELLCDDGRNGEGRLIDVQWLTPHMASLGAYEVQRADYLSRLQRTLDLPQPGAFKSSTM